MSLRDAVKSKGYNDLYIIMKKYIDIKSLHLKEIKKTTMYCKQ